MEESSRRQSAGELPTAETPHERFASTASSSVKATAIVMTRSVGSKIESGNGVWQGWSRGT